MQWRENTQAAGAAGGGLIIAAPGSGSGKTVFTLGLLRHLARSGAPVAACKAGPDYIDPAFHAAACGRPSVNLDPWGMRPATLAGLAAAAGRDGTLVICEGVMGLFDGAAGTAGSTADLAALTGWPVVLVIDAGAQAASAAAVLRGFAGHRPDVTVAGVVFNRTGGPGHDAILRDACTAALAHIPVLGCLQEEAALVLPERHLGLVQAAERDDLDVFLDAAAAAVARQIDMAALTGLARPCRMAPPEILEPLVPPLGQRIAVAADVAFAFAYPAVLDGWHDAGAEVMPFSPLAGESPGTDADAIYLPGGYPELHAGPLAAAPFLPALAAAAGRGVTIFGECGGYMVLGAGLVDGAGDRHAMAGLLPLETSFAVPGLHLGYREATVLAGPLGESGAGFRAHEFHFANILREGPGEALFECAAADGRALGKTGLVAGRTMGSFLHLIDRMAV